MQVILYCCVHSYLSSAYCNIHTQWSVVVCVMLVLCLSQSKICLKLSFWEVQSMPKSTTKMSGRFIILQRSSYRVLGSMSEYRACSIRDYYKHCSMISNSVRGRARWWCAVSLVVFNCMTWWHADARKSVSINNFHELLLCSDAIIIVFENTCTKLRPRFGPVRLCH